MEAALQVRKKMLSVPKMAAVVAIVGTVIFSSCIYTRRRNSLHSQRRHRYRRGLLFDLFRDPKTVELRQNVHSHESLRQHDPCLTDGLNSDSTRDPKSVGKSNNFYSHGSKHQSSSSSALPGGGYGYSNLSCPYEWSKYSCSFILEHLGEDASGGDISMARETLDASTDYYLERMDMIQSAFRLVSMQGRDQQPRRVFFTGDSLMRQLFVAIACNAMSALPEKENLIEHSVIPWKDAWPSTGIPCLIAGGQHSGFDAASMRLTNNLEIHFVPHGGYIDSLTAEHDVLKRLQHDIIDYNGRITFGTKTAIPLPLDAHVDVLVYNDGMSVHQQSSLFLHMFMGNFIFLSRF
jgi:hypothetical protein